jgi:lysyl-tRNA synthetase class II
MKKTVLFLAFLVACGGEEAPDVVVVSTSKPEWKMAEDPGTAYSVADAKEELPTEEVIVAGRIHRMVKGYATFTLMDDKLDFCGEVQKEDTCKTPWDYCCDTPADRLANSCNVQFEDSNGKVLKTELFGELKHCDLVVVRGKVTKDEHGNVTVHAREYFVRERPKLADDVRWP